MASELERELNERLRQSNVRFIASMNRILEQYNHPFEDDLLISMETLTYVTPEGPKQWGEVPIKKLKKRNKEALELNRRIQRNAEMSTQQTSDFEDGHSTLHQESSENSYVDTSDRDEESDDDIVSVRRKFENIHFQHMYVDNGKIQEKRKVQVDVIVQEDARNIPKWITIAPEGNQAAVCRKKIELSKECSSRPLQLQLSGAPTSPNTITIPRHQHSLELNETCCDRILEEYQSADEECSWSNVTLVDLYPAMLETLIRFMTKQSQRKHLKYMFRLLRLKRRYSGKREFSVTVGKNRGFRPLKLKKALPSICSRRSEDIENQTFGNENRELCDDRCSLNNSSGLVPYSYTDTSENRMDYSDSSLERYLVSGKGQKVSKQTVSPNVMSRIGEQTTFSLNNLKCKESEKLSYQCSSRYSFTPAASSGSKALHLVKESKTQTRDIFGGDTSELCSSTSSSYDNSNTSTPVANCSRARASSTLLINPEKIISERGISFQHKHSFSSLSVKQSPSKMPEKYKDEFEELYYKLCSQEIQKPLIFTRPRSNSQNFEEKGRLMKRNLSDSVRTDKHYDREFDRIYEQLCSEAVPKSPGFQRASNLRKYGGIQMSETVNALVNSPGRSLSTIPRVKRQGNFQNDLLSSPLKRQKNIPERNFPSTECQQISHRKILNLQTAGMDFLSIHNGSNPSVSDSYICICGRQDSGFHPSSDKTSLGIPGDSLQETGIADAHCGGARAVKNYSCQGDALRHHKIQNGLSAGKSP
ncbi:Holliday junction recognition protein isoform X2 [Tyto alba]|uniref:Holliday junction recognition protein isoform X2 n=1 Tax=Tyto alba TaxID=56313 RepID=UPI001C664445|nr:Holliday junction recognition protein isoform X2 [Tyto alba]